MAGGDESGSMEVCSDPLDNNTELNSGLVQELKNENILSSAPNSIFFYHADTNESHTLLYSVLVHFLTYWHTFSAEDATSTCVYTRSRVSRDM